MGKILLSLKSEDDLRGIADYTIKKFGIIQAQNYRETLERCIEHLRAHPQVGKPVNKLAKGLRQYICSSHRLFYQVKELDIFIVRILHKSMAQEKYLY